MGTSRGGPESVGLAELTAQLGADVLRPLRPLAAVGDAAVGPVVLVEADDVVAELPTGALAAAAGIGGGDPRLPAVLAACAAAGAIGVVVKARGVTATELDEIAAGAGIPLLLVPDDLPWLHLVELVATARLRAHDTASATALGDLFGLATAVAAATGGATAVEDPSRRILAYSTLPGQEIDEARQLGILGRQVPHYPSNDADYRRLYRCAGVMRLEPGVTSFGRLAVAVRSGAELLGSIWVVDSGGLSPDAEAVLVDAGRLAALHLLRARSRADVERQARAETLRALLDGRLAAEPAAERLGWAADQPCQLVAVALPSAAADDELGLERLHELVALRCAGLSTRGLTRHVTAAAGAAVWALLADPGAGAATALAEGLASRAGAVLGSQPHIAIGEPGLAPAGVPASRIELEDILRLLDRPQEPRLVGSRATVHAALVLLRIQQQLQAQPAMLLESVAAVLDFDRSQSGHYVETLLAYLDCFGDVVAASGRMSVHPNTFRYRLRRARELFGIDLDDPANRLVLWLQLTTARG